MTANTVGMASAAISSGSPAATSVPNTASRMSSAIGRLIVSAMTRSCSIFWLNSWYSCGTPVTCTSTPAGASTASARRAESSTADSTVFLQVDDGQGRGAVLRKQGRGGGIGVGHDALDIGVVGDVGQAALHGGLESGRGGVAIRVLEDDEHGRLGGPEAVRQDVGRLLLLRARDDPAALDQRAAANGGPDVQADDERQADDRQQRGTGSRSGRGRRTSRSDAAPGRALAREGQREEWPWCSGTLRRDLCG